MLVALILLLTTIIIVVIIIRTKLCGNNKNISAIYSRTDVRVKAGDADIDLI